MICVIYACHNVIPLSSIKKERGTVSLDTFSRQIKCLKRLGVSFIRMKDLLEWFDGRKALPKRVAVLTFDDAYASVGQYAFPVLKQEEIPFTIFVIAGYIGRESNFYVDRGGNAKRHLNTDELRFLIKSGLVEIGAHGYDHHDMSTLDVSELTHELREAKTFLENTLNVKVPYLAYPYGKTADEVVEEVKRSGYKLAFTTRKKKVTSKNVDFLRLPRVNWGRSATLFKLFKYYLIPFVRSAG